MGRVKEWGMEIANMVFDREWDTGRIVKIFKSRAAHMNFEIDVAWLYDQIQAVRDNPQWWNRSIDYWARKKRSLRKHPPERQTKISGRTFNQQSKFDMRDIGYPKKRRKRTWGKRGD